TVQVEVDGEVPITLCSDIKPFVLQSKKLISLGTEKIFNRPVIIGSGPAGLFAALKLSEYGYSPILFERGDCVEDRTRAVDNYWKTGILDVESNVQFGEGGAGTFSDGKLTTRINDERCNEVLDVFRDSGVSDDILYKAKPHIGTDKLKDVLAYIKRKIISNGGDIRFRSKITDIKIVNGKLVGVVINENEIIDTEIVVLAIGHSARDTFEMLKNKNIQMTRKAFSIGVRIEHPQELINKAQFGKFANHPRLGAAEYQLFKKIGDRTVYSFCMCPGGVVVAAASEENSIVTNGMSEYARDRMNANSALVVSVTPDDYGSNDPLAGMYFQRLLERKAFDVGGGAAPVQKVGDFIAGRKSIKIGSVIPSYTGSTACSDINNILPEFITSGMKDGIIQFNSMLKGFGLNESIITGVETRTSSPVRIERDEYCQSININGLFPCGEGAGYAGGIMSAAVDGIRVSECIINKFSTL
ncbi:MAG: hypothetical protein A2355_13805, partial [Spirochaetes bacterium RIFOXYB1_FULL_32_8]